MQILLGLALGFVVAFVFPTPADAQGLARAKSAEDVGLSAERLKRISTTLQAGVEQSEIPGAVLLVARKGKVAYFESVGYRDREAKAPMSRDAIFRIASMTKPIVTVAAMILVEEGKLSLPAPVSRYLPEFKDLKVGVEKKDDSGKTQLVLEDPVRDMTVYDLLRHMSGLTYGAFGRPSMVKTLYNEAKVLDSNQTTAEMITKLSKIPLQHQPGTTWDYSMSIDVLGRVVEVVSGTTLDEFISQRVTGPLRMRDTGFWVDRSNHGRIAEPQIDTATGKRPTVPDKTHKLNFLSGGGGMVSTAADYARFCQFLLNKGQLAGVRLLARTTVEYMTSDHIPPGARVINFPIAILDTNPDNGQSFGLGFAVRVSSGRSAVPESVGSVGWTGIYGTSFFVDPKEQMFAVFMVQGGSIASRANYWTLTRVLAYQAVVD
jgi:CubicO group peptidase (beta-lactamase class C family)